MFDKLPTIELVVSHEKIYRQLWFVEHAMNQGKLWADRHRSSLKSFTPRMMQSAIRLKVTCLSNHSMIQMNLAETRA